MVPVAETIQRGLQLQNSGYFDEAEQAYGDVLAQDPQNFDALHLLGLVAHQTGRSVIGASLIEKAVELDPSAGIAFSNLGSIYLALDRGEEAKRCLEKAVHLLPDHSAANYNFALVLAREGRLSESRPYSARAHEIDPEFVEAQWINAIARFPATSDTASAAGKDLEAFVAGMRDLDAWFDKRRTREGYKAVGILQPLMLAYREQENREALQAYGKLCCRLMESWQASQSLQRRPYVRADKIRMGVVSAHLREHSIWQAITKGLFEHLDRGRFELFVFHLSALSDAQTDHAKSGADAFAAGSRDLRGWVEAIFALRPDVLLYPEIGMDSMTLRLASMRLAPVQATTWGHPETSGLPTIDYYFSAEDFEPPNGGQHYSEELVTLPHLGCSYQSLKAEASEVDLARYGIKEGVPLLICPGTPFKYAHEYDGLLPELARRIGPCQFVFFFSTDFPYWTEKLKDRLSLAFARAELRLADYVVFLHWLPRSEFYGLMRRATVCLDTIGFSGFNTAVQVLECDLPIVTREGRFLRGRFASGVLKRMGIPELIAATEEDYVNVAAKVVQDGEFRKALCCRIAASRHAIYHDTAPIRAMEDFLVGAVERSRRS